MGRFRFFLPSREHLKCVVSSCLGLCFGGFHDCYGNEGSIFFEVSLICFLDGPNHEEGPKWYFQDLNSVKESEREVEI